MDGWTTRRMDEMNPSSRRSLLYVITEPKKLIVINGLWAMAAVLALYLNNLKHFEKCPKYMWRPRYIHEYPS
jgi:hypothetical protein